MPAECVAPVKGEPCGILAVARCKYCEAPLCRSHLILDACPTCAEQAEDQRPRACPECGGRNPIRIGPGMWLCNRSKWTVQAVTGWDYGPPCDTVYRDPELLDGTYAVCRCGTFALGSCRECDQPLCYHHAHIVTAPGVVVAKTADSDLYCAPHATALIEQREQELRRDAHAASRVQRQSQPLASDRDIAEFLANRLPADAIHVGPMSARELGRLIKRARQRQNQAGAFPHRMSGRLREVRGWIAGSGYFVTNRGEIFEVRYREDSTYYTPVDPVRPVRGDLTSEQVEAILGIAPETI